MYIYYLLKDEEENAKEYYDKLITFSKLFNKNLDKVLSIDKNYFSSRKEEIKKKLNN